MKTQITIAALGLLMAGSALATSYSNLPAPTTGLQATQVHSVNFAVDVTKEPVTITDGGVQNGNLKKGVVAVVYSSHFPGTANMKYKLTAGNMSSGLALTLADDADTTTADKTLATGSGADIYINVVKEATALTAGQYQATYTLSEYQS